MSTWVTQSATRPRAGGPELAGKVLFLAQPQNYAEATAHVDTIETHMSWVFLTDRSNSLRPDQVLSSRRIMWSVACQFDSAGEKLSLSQSTYYLSRTT